MHKTFLCAHTHRKHQPQIQHAKCVRLTSASFPVQLCRSKAYAKCQCMDLRVAQRSMIRTKQSMYISTHTQYLQRQERQSTRTHTPDLERERTHAHTQYLQRQERRSTRTHTPYLEREDTRTHTQYLQRQERESTRTHSIHNVRERESTRTHAQYLEREHTHTHTRYRESESTRTHNTYRGKRERAHAHTHHI